MEGWVLYAVLGTVVSLATADFLAKVASGRIASSVAMLIYGSCTFLSGLGWVLWRYAHGMEQPVQTSGLLAALGVGICFSFVTMGLYTTLGAGAPVSVAVPLIRLGGLLLASLAGLVLLGEPLTLRYAIGMVLVVTGVYLVIVVRKKEPGQ